MSVKKGDEKLYVTKDDFKRLQEKVETLLDMKNDIPPLPPAPPPPRPPNRMGSVDRPSTVTSAADPPGRGGRSHSARTCTRPGCDHTGHNYEEVTPPTTAPPPVPVESDDHQYERLQFDEDIAGDDIPSRLRKVETNQQRIIKSQDSIKKDVAEIKTAMEKLQQTLDKIHFQFLENSDHLGQQILHVRRDILAASKKEPSTFRPQDHALQERLQQPRRTHNFEWEVSNVDNLVRTQRQVSSQSYHIGQLDFKIIGAASCTKDGRMHLRIFGDFTHLPMDESERKCGRFICTVNIVDRSGSLQDWIVGKVVGDFNKDKQFMVGDVAVGEIKQKGFCGRGGNVQLRFDIEIYV